MAARRKITLDRRKVVARILKDRGDLLLVTGLGAPTWDAASVEDNPNNFYLWGGMGGAVLTGLGLALAQPKRRVLVITGDGEMLMGIGGLATVAVQKPSNLAICIVDNQRYGETGMQETHTAHGVDLPAMAAAASRTAFKTAGAPQMSVTPYSSTRRRISWPSTLRMMMCLPPIALTA